MSDNFNTEQEEDVVQTPRKRAPKIITVYGAQKQERDRVAFFEKNEAHPDGEVYVVNDGQPVQVAETAAVKRALGEQRLTTERVNWNSLINKPVRPLRNATAQEETNAGLTGSVEKETAKVPEGEAVIRRGGRPGGK